MEQAEERFVLVVTLWAEAPKKSKPSGMAANISQLPAAPNSEMDLPQAEDDFLRMDRQMAEFPTLVYDGPFSDHMDEREPQGLGEGVISAAEANTIAREFISPGNAKDL